jgi:NAD(P)-dependent dehydrogenase (short-subunit alcohol dehydrogenase family)
MNSRVIVVTGASAGVGRAIVRQFARDYALGVTRDKPKIALIARNRQALEIAQLEVAELGGEALILPLDVSDPDAVEQAASIVEEKFGPIDVWVNNAAVSVFSPVKEMNAREFKRINEVSYLGYVYGTISALKRMIPRNRGVIIQVSSLTALRSVPLRSAHNAAKLAVEGFTKSLRAELKNDRSAVHVTLVHLPTMNTPHYSWTKSRLPRGPRPIRPAYQPEIGAKAVVFASKYPRKKLDFGSYAKTPGYQLQQTLELLNPERRDNLWATVPGDHGARGKFSLEARKFSSELWFLKNRALIFSGILMPAAALFLLNTGMFRRFFSRKSDPTKFLSDAASRAG